MSLVPTGLTITTSSKGGPSITSMYAFAFSTPITRENRRKRVFWHGMEIRCLRPPELIDFHKMWMKGDLYPLSRSICFVMKSLGDVMGSVRNLVGLSNSVLDGLAVNTKRFHIPYSPKNTHLKKIFPLWRIPHRIRHPSSFIRQKPQVKHY